MRIFEDNAAMDVTPIDLSIKGKVYLIGAGPGDPDLITVRGLRILQKADVVVYDRLANSALLSETRVDARQIYVGKTAGHPSVSQARINRILIREAREGKQVVRLKGGDPFVFGRGGEELEVLAAGGIPYEVVPGISSSVAAAAFAGIPLTHRDYSSSFTVITGHTIHEGGFSVKWDYLAHCETLVILMGLRKLPAIAQKLIENGRPGTTPAAVIEKATYGSQRKVVGTLLDIAEKAERLSTPATIVIGEVVRLSEMLDWFRPEAQILEPEALGAVSFG